MKKKKSINKDKIKETIKKFTKIMFIIRFRFIVINILKTINKLND